MRGPFRRLCNKIAFEESSRYFIIIRNIKSTESVVL